MAKSSGHIRNVVSESNFEISSLIEQYISLLQELNRKASQDILMMDAAGGLTTLITKTVSELIKMHRDAKINSEKTKILKAIIQNNNYRKLERASTDKGSVFVLSSSDYDDKLKAGEMPSNIHHARKFALNGYDVFLLSNPNGIKSGDFIIRKKERLFYVEGKTSTGQNSLDHNFDNGSTQSDIVSVNLTNNTDTKYVRETIKKAFTGNSNLKKVILFKGSRLIKITRQDALGKQYEKKFNKIWNKSK